MSAPAADNFLVMVPPTNLTPGEAVSLVAAFDLLAGTLKRSGHWNELGITRDQEGGWQAQGQEYCDGDVSSLQPHATPFAAALSILEKP